MILFSDSYKEKHTNKNFFTKIVLDIVTDLVKQNKKTRLLCITVFVSIKTQYLGVGGLVNSLRSE